MAVADKELLAYRTSAVEWINQTFAELGLMAAGVAEMDDLANTDLADPGADRVVFWDDSDGQYEHLIMGNGLAITTNTLAVVDSEIDHGSISGLADNDHNQYLLINCSNDPLTAGLEINAATEDEPTLILKTTDDNAANPVLDVQSAAGATRLKITADGSLTITPSANGISIVDINQADGAAVFDVDTVNRKIVVTSGTTGQSTIGAGLIVNNDSGNGAINDFQVNSSNLTAILVDASADTMVFGVPIADKIMFTQTDGNEAIDSLNDGYMDYLATTAHRFNTPVRGTTSLWWRIQHVDLVNVSKGASAAVWMSLDANHLSGYQLDADTEYLYFNVHVGTDWDEASDLELVVQFETNVNNAAGAGTDTVDFDLLMYYKGATETANKTQSLDAFVEVGTAAQYYHQQVTFTIDHDKVDHVVQIGDCVGMRLNLDVTTGEVTNVIVHHAMFRYKTDKVRAEV